MNNLAKARKTVGMTQQQVADAIGVTLQAYQNYEYGRRDVRSTVLVKLAKALGCTTDYLLGLTDDPTPFCASRSRRKDGVIIQQETPVSRKRITEARLSKRMSQSGLAKLVGTTQQQIARYEKDENDLKSSVLVKLSEALDVSITYLLGLTDDPKHLDVEATADEPGDGLTPDERNLLARFREASPDVRSAMLTMAGLVHSRCAGDGRERLP